MTLIKYSKNLVKFDLSLATPLTLTYISLDLNTLFKRSRVRGNYQ